MKQAVLTNPEGSACVLLTQACDTASGMLLASPLRTLPGESAALDLREPGRSYIVSSVPLVSIKSLPPELTAAPRARFAANRKEKR